MPLRPSRRQLRRFNYFELSGGGRTRSVECEQDERDRHPRRRGKHIPYRSPEAALKCLGAAVRHGTAASGLQDEHAHTCVRTAAISSGHAVCSEPGSSRYPDAQTLVGCLRQAVNAVCERADRVVDSPAERVSSMPTPDSAHSALNRPMPTPGCGVGPWFHRQWDSPWSLSSHSSPLPSHRDDTHAHGH